LQLVVIFAEQYGELRALPQTDVYGERKEVSERELMKLKGWSNKGRQRKDGRRKGRSSVIHPT